MIVCMRFNVVFQPIRRTLKGVVIIKQQQRLTNRHAIHTYEYKTKK